MEYRNLGRTGVKVSEICLGCMMFGGRTNQEDSADIIDRAIDEGVNFLDTANVYSTGASEEAVGKALKRNGKRDAIVLATKVHGAMDEEDPNAAGNHRRHIIEQCEASLRRLQVDHIDLYQIHRPSSDIPIDETLRALDDLIHAGKVRYVGTSTFAAWQLVEALWVAKELGLNRFVSEQPPYHLLERRIERELVPLAQTYGTALIPWSPLSGGFLTGKYSRDESRSPEDSRYGIQPRRMGRNHFTDEAFVVLEAVQAIANEKGCTPGQVALAWCKDKPGVTSPIIGPRTMEQLEDNLGAVEVSLDESDHERLDAVAPPGRAIVPYYEADFGPHRFRSGQLISTSDLLLLVPCRASAGRCEGQPQDDASCNDHDQAPPKVHVKAEVALARSGRGDYADQDHRDAVDKDEGCDIEAYRHGVVRA